MSQKRRSVAQNPRWLRHEQASVVLRSIIDDYSTAFEKARTRLGDDSDVEALHDVRVAARRLRSLLKRYRPLLKRSRSLKLLSKTLSKCLELSNRIRDAEVMVEWFERFQPKLSPTEQQAFALLLAELKTEREAGRRKMRKERRKYRFGKSVDVHFKKEAERSFALIFKTLVREAAEEFSSKMAEIGVPTDDNALHQARLSAKRLRYLLEPIGKSSSDLGTYVECLGGLQTLLGELHDLYVVEERLLEYGRRTGGDVVKEALRQAVAGITTGHRKRTPEDRFGLLRSLVRLCADAKKERFSALKAEWLGNQKQKFSSGLLEIVRNIGERPSGDREQDHAAVARTEKRR